MFEVEDGQRPFVSWTGMKFSPDGRDLLVSTSEGVIYLINSFEGALRQVLQGAKPYPKKAATATDFEAAFSPDGKYVLSGSADKKVCVWRRDTGKLLCGLEGHSGVPSVLKFNPVKQMFASGCENLVQSNLFVSPFIK